MRTFLIVLSITFAFFSCTKDVSNKKGTIVFNNTIIEVAKKSGIIADFDSVAFAVVTIKNNNETTEYTNKKIELFKIGGDILSSPLELNEGNYQLTDFYLIDVEGNILFIAPKEGSDKAQYVKVPLSIEFSIYNNEVTKTNVEVLSVVNAEPEDFGYSEFGVFFVQTFDILVSLFEYDSNSVEYVLTQGTIEVLGTDFTMTDSLDATNNVITLLDNLSAYRIKISKDGVLVYDYTFAIDSIKKHKVETLKPLKVLIAEERIVILQPGSNEGKDARIATYTTDQEASAAITNYAAAQEITAIVWTFGGNVGETRGLIDFSLPDILNGKNITEAKLYLTAVANLSYCINAPSHSQLSGSNACFLSQITSAWEENVVTWNTQPTVSTENRILMPASENDMQNYVVDVTEFIRRELANPNDYHGFMLHLVTEEYYRRLHFGSSDAPDPSTHPKLVIKY